MQVINRIGRQKQHNRHGNTINQQHRQQIKLTETTYRRASPSPVWHIRAHPTRPTNNAQAPAASNTTTSRTSIYENTKPHTHRYGTGGHQKRRPSAALCVHSHSLQAVTHIQVDARMCMHLERFAKYCVGSSSSSSAAPALALERAEAAAETGGAALAFAATFSAFFFAAASTFSWW